MHLFLKSWLLIAGVAYFLHAVTAIIDKFLLEKRILRPSTYAFFTGITGIFALFFFPFAFFIPTAPGLFFSVLSGLINLCILLVFYCFAKKRSIARSADYRRFQPDFRINTVEFFFERSTGKDGICRLSSFDRRRSAYQHFD